MSARFPLALMAIIALLVIPASAQAMHPLPKGGLASIDGTTAYAQDGHHLNTRDLVSGANKTLPLPAEYAYWNDSPAVSNGRYAGVTDDNENSGIARLFVTGPEGITYLSSWKEDLSQCGSKQLPLGLSKSGDVTILELAQTHDAPTHSCLVDIANTRLVLRSLTGATKQLWLPAKYAAWLAKGSAKLRGDQLLISRPATGSSSGRFVVLDVAKKKVVFKADAGRSFVDAVPIAKYGALARYRHDYRVSARHFSYYLPHSRLIYRGNHTQIYACGARTLVAGIGSIKMIGLHRNTLFSKSRKGNYDYSSVVCSEQVVSYALEPNVPDIGEDPNLPPRVTGLLDLSKFYA
ncbi:MAG: hypothetical protein QM648_01860 [Solirubrobacterales bacterium]